MGGDWAVDRASGQAGWQPAAQAEDGGKRKKKGTELVAGRSRGEPDGRNDTKRTARAERYETADETIGRSGK